MQRSGARRVLSIFLLLAVAACSHPHARALPLASARTGEPAPLPAAEKWQTFAMAQVVAWLDAEHLAVGRWDGALTVFAVPSSQSQPLALVDVAATPARHPIEMIVTLPAGRIVTSNDAGSLAEWRFDARTGATLANTVAYDATFGVANSATVVTAGKRRWLVTGHANGRVLIWNASARPLRLRQAVDVRSPDPVSPPWGPALRNVRGLAGTADGRVVAGAEDGDLTLIAVPSGVVRTRLRYNPEARLGINALALVDDHLLVVNCALGEADRNLWSFRVHGDELTRLGANTLVLDATRPQVFAFGVVADEIGEDERFYASTEEGLVWGGRIAAGAPEIVWREAVDAGLGAALALHGKRLAVVSYNVRVFTLQ